MIQIKPSRPIKRAAHIILAVLLVLPGCEAVLKATQEDMPVPSPYGKIVREIHILGLHNTADSIVRNQMVSHEGRIYTEENEKQDHRWLERLKVFNSIESEALVVGDEVVLTIRVQELPEIAPFPTLNVTSSNGASGGLGATIPSLMHRAVALTGSAKFGGLTEADISIKAPWRLERREWYQAKYNYKDRVNSQDSFHENSHELDLRLGVSLYPNWMLSGGFGFMSMGSDIPGITLSPNNRDRIPALGLALEYDGLDSQSIPHEGWQGIFDITQNGGFLGGDGDFVTTQIDIRRYQPIASRHFLVFLTYGSIQSGIVGQDVPVYRDYQLGGTNSVRGWDSNARRGKNQWINTLEYRYELVPLKTFRVSRFNLYTGLQLVAFTDVGTVWTEGSEFSGNMIMGGGFGFHILVPFVDTIRVDFGFGQPDTGMHAHIHIREKAHYSRNRIR
jgi:outer membrane protein assembly factor BamA